jgi:TP901 family phage tail tape measure protein
MPFSGAIRAGRAFIEIFADDSKLVRGLKRARAKLRAFGASVKASGAQMLRVSAVMAAPFALASGVFAKFEQSMARVQALTGATGRDFKRLSTKAKRLGQTTVFSASQAAEAMSFFALAGLDVQQIFTAIGPTLNLAAAGQIEIADAADIVAKVMAGMGIEANQLGHVVDVLAKAMTTANTDLQQLGDAMKFVGPIAKSAGVAFEEIVAKIQLLSNAGIQAEMAGTSLRGALLTLTSPSKEAAKKLEELDVVVLDAQRNVRQLADIIDDLHRGTAAMGKGERLGALGQIFPTRQAAAMAELLSQGGRKLRAFTETLRASGGTAAFIAGVQLDTLRGTAVILKSTLEGLAITVGEALVKPLRATIVAVTKAVRWFGEWLETNKPLVAVLAASAVIVGSLGAALVSVGLMVQVLAFALSPFLIILPAIASGFGLVLTALGAILSPIGLLIGAVVGLGIQLIRLTGTTGKVMSLLGQGFSWLANAGDKALSWLIDKFNILKDDAIASYQGIADALAAGDIALAAQILWLSLKLEWTRGINFLEQQWTNWKTSFLKTAGDAFDGAVAASERAWNSIQSGWTKTKGFFSRTYTRIKSSLARGANWMSLQAQKTGNVLNKIFDPDLNLAEANRRATESAKEGSKRIEADKAEALLTRDKKTKRQLAAQEELHNATMAEIGKENLEQHRKLDEEYKQRIAENEGDLAKARKEWQDALAKARGDDFVGPPAPEGGPGVLEDPKSWVAQLRTGLLDVDSSLETARERTIDVSGTFNAAAVLGLQAGGFDDRIANATERTVKELEGLRADTRNNRPQFP